MLTFVYIKVIFSLYSFEIVYNLKTKLPVWHKMAVYWTIKLLDRNRFPKFHRGVH